MIRHLRYLSRPVRAAGPGAAALAVYAEPGPDGLQLRAAAAETGFEGVACVDDAARALVLYAALWRRYRLEWARTEARRLLQFICYMQDDAGRFANFVQDWDGAKNLTCDNSVPGGPWWTSRAMRALAEGFALFEDGEYRDRFLRGLEQLDRPSSLLRARAIAILAALRWWRTTGDDAFADRALAWSEELLSASVGGMITDVPAQPSVELWGHIQEAAVARTGALLGRPTFVAAAAASARAVFARAVLRAFRATRTLPFEVSSAVFVISTLAEVTGDPAFDQQAALARHWFRDRNAARRVMYDRRRGVVFDGIDLGRRSRNCGAESNIEAALALVPELPLTRYAG